MGGSKDYIAEGGFLQKKYREVKTVNGIKQIERDDGEGSTPLYSNTPNAVYAKADRETGEVNQVAVYGNRKSGNPRMIAKQIDIGHKHSNKRNGKIIKTFTVKDIHVHDFDEHGQRSKIARKPSKKERRLFMLARNKR